MASSLLFRYAEVTAQLVEERARIEREHQHAGRPAQSLRMAELVEERAKLAVAIADAALRAEVGR